MTTVLKIGGSVVTDKQTPETVDERTLASVAADIGSAAAESESADLVLVHGGGSFGHHHAEKHGVTDDRGTTDAAALSAIHGAMRELNGRVIDALQSAGVPALPISPLSVAHRDDGKLTFPVGQIERALGEGFVPVTHGDVVVTANAGGTVISGDDIVVSLARSLAADRIGLCSDVPGVLDSSGAVVSRIEREDEFVSAASDETTDVTGGMAAKVRTLLALGRPACVFGPDDLARFLIGDDPGTVIDGTE